MALPAGIPLGSYRLLRVLGQGGFGITYLAEHTGSGQQVVIKENLPAAFAYRVSGSHRVYASGGAVQKDFDWALTRFVDEARILAALQHPGVVRVLECFEALGTAYYVMPWVGGEVLSKAAPAPAVITESWLLPQLRRLLVTLEYLHGRNVLHRDIKPANVLLQADGEPILIDFGAARIMVSERSATHIESEGYTPIEQLQSGSKHGPWTDLYALGATCYRLITGERPPRSVNRMGKRDCYQPLAARKELTQRFSPAFLKGIDKALAIWPEDRWQSAAEWLRSLPAEKVKKEALSEPSPSAQDPVKGSARLPWVLVLLLLLLLAAGGVGILYHLNTASEWEQKLTAAEQRATTAEQRATTAEQKLQEVAPLVEIGQKVKEEEARKAREEEERRVREATREGALARLRELGVSSPDGADLCSAAEAGNIEKVRLMLAAGINPNSATKSSETPLCMAAREGHAEVVKLLLAAPGIDVNKAYAAGWTPLSWAAREGHAEVVKLLLAAPGIDVNKADAAGWTPLYHAAWGGHAEVVKLLLAAPGIDVNKTDVDGWTPLKTALVNNKTECAELIRAAGGHE